MKVFGHWRSWNEAANGLDGLVTAETAAGLGEAYVFAAENHRGQFRPAGEPYVWHLLEVIELLAVELGVTDGALLTAGLLHDVVEDTNATLAETSQRFGARTASLVEAVTMPKLVSSGDKAAARKTYLGGIANAPVDVVRLKLADRYSNIQRLHTHPQVAKQRSYFAETVEHFLPLAGVDVRLARLFTEWADAYDFLTGEVETVDAADKLAACAHREQIDKTGKPYVDHVRRTAQIATAHDASEHQQMAALLHDSVEDTLLTLDQLRHLGTPPAVVDMVDALTHRTEEPQQDYLKRLAQTPDAILVKRADIEDNQSPQRLAQLDPDTQQRLRAKYRTALDILDGARP